MFAKVSLAAAFFLMVGAPLAGASEGARPTKIFSAISSAPASPRIVVAQEAQFGDSAGDSNSDSNDSSDSDNSQNADGDQNGDGNQNGDSNQTDQQSMGAQGYQAPDFDAGEAGQLNSYPQQVNPNQ